MAADATCAYYTHLRTPYFLHALKADLFKHHLSGVALKLLTCQLGPSCHRWQEVDRITVLQLGRRAATKADILAIDVDVDKRSWFAIMIKHSSSKVVAHLVRNFCKGILQVRTFY